MQRACASCTGLAHTLIRLSYSVKQPACPDCQLGLLFHLVALVNEPMRGWRSSLEAIHRNRGPLPMLPQYPAFLLSPIFTLRMERELIPNQEKGGQGAEAPAWPHSPRWLQWRLSHRHGFLSVCLCLCFRRVCRFLGCSQAASRPLLISGRGGRMRVSVRICLFPVTGPQTCSDKQFSQSFTVLLFKMGR